MARSNPTAIITESAAVETAKIGSNVAPNLNAGSLGSMNASKLAPVDPKQVGAIQQPGSGACASGTPGGGGPGGVNGSKSDSGLGSGIDPTLKNAALCGQQKFQAANPGYKVHFFSGRAGRGLGGSAHPDGKAVDFVVESPDGGLINNIRAGDTPAAQVNQAVANATASCYYEQTGKTNLSHGANFQSGVTDDGMHLDIGSSGERGALGSIAKGKPGFKYNKPYDGTANSWTVDNPSESSATKNSGVGAAQGSKTNAGLEGGNAGGNSTCGNYNSGCAPINASAPAAAAAMAKGAGMAPGAGMLGALGGIAQTATGGIGGLVSQAAGLAMGNSGIAGMAIKAVTSGMNPTGILTQAAGGLVQQLGGGSNSPFASAITGVVNSVASGQGLVGSVTGVVQGLANNIIGQGLPQLGGFTNVFSSALGAAASGGSLKGILESATTQVFGQMAGALGSTTAGALFDQMSTLNSKIPGTDFTSALNKLNPTNDPDRGEVIYEAMAGRIANSWANSVSNNLNYTDEFKTVLQKVVNKNKIDGFSSVYADYQSFITHGFGNLTDSMFLLGTDLVNLGGVGDLTDLFNIGTPQQLARQLIENGLGVSTGLISMMLNEGITVNDLFNEDYTDTLFDILDSINDVDIIQQIKTVMAISEFVELDTVADLLRPEKVFRYSLEFNRFKNIRDMAIQLAMISNTNYTMRHFGDLGSVLLNLETLETATELLEEYNVARPSDIEELKFELPADSYFNSQGITIADFIGTAAGYVHERTLSKMSELYAKLDDHSAMAKYLDLMDLLKETLENPLVVVVLTVKYVRVANTAGYTFGDYTSLDLAITAIVDAVESELDNIYTASQSDTELYDILFELNANYTETNEFLAHEKKMRKAYGIDIGPPEKIEHYFGDGITTSFKLEEVSSGDIDVHVSGVMQYSNSWSFNPTTNSVVFNTAPAENSIIRFKYSTQMTLPQANNNDVWQFATMLEQYALQTGYGNPADFLSRIITNDLEGQRIKSIMIQSRNKYRLNLYGIDTPNYPYITDIPGDPEFNFIAQTGVWSDLPERAAEIWVQQKTNANSMKQYMLDRIARNKDTVLEDASLLMQNIMRRMLFLTSDNQIAFSQEFTFYYDDTIGERIFSPELLDFQLQYSDELPTDGFILGNYTEILSEILRIEGLTDDTFNVPLSEATQNYLIEIEMDMKHLVAVMQRLLSTSFAYNYGITEADVKNVFEQMSVSKYLLMNIAAGY